MRAFGVAKVLIVNDQDEILVIRRSQTDDRRPGEWDIPGGWLEPGEEGRAAVLREAVEEVGIKLDDATLVFAHSEMTTRFGSGTWLFYVARVKGRPAVTLSYEHDAHDWKKMPELLKEITYERQLMMLKYVHHNDLLKPTA